jgi:hypothetical protein
MSTKYQIGKGKKNLCQPYMTCRGHENVFISITRFLFHGSDWQFFSVTIMHACTIGLSNTLVLAQQPNIGPYCGVGYDADSHAGTHKPGPPYHLRRFLLISPASIVEEIIDLCSVPLQLFHSSFFYVLRIQNLCTGSTVENSTAL